MDQNKKKKTLIVNTIVLVFCIGIIAAFCMIPANKVETLQTFKVSFDPNDGGSVAAIEIEDGKIVEEPDAPTRDGYVFIGWMLGDELYDFSQSVSGDITLKAAWQELEPDKVYYTVSFATDGGTTYANQVLESGQVVSKPEDPVKDGFIFRGWQVNGVDYDFNQPVNMDLIIVAVWEAEEEEPEEPEEPEDDEKEDDSNKTYTVRFNGNGGTLGRNCGNQSIKNGSLARNTCTATRSGYTLVGFNTNKNASSSNISSTRITKNVTFYAIWREIPKTYYNLSFNLNGGSGSCSAVRLESGTRITTSILNRCKPTKKYYNLSSWQTSNGSNANGILLTSNATVTASWSKQSFKVTCTLPDAYAQDCVLTVSGVPNSDIDKIEYSFSGRWINVGTYSGGYRMNNSVFKQRASSFRVTIDGEIFNASK